MKAIVASLAAAAILCIVILAQNALAQADWGCYGPQWFCNDNSNCTAQSGTCPAGGKNAGTAYSYVTTFSSDVWVCEPGDPGCNDTVLLPYCNFSCYQSRGMSGVCINMLCNDWDSLLQCM